MELQRKRPASETQRVSQMKLSPEDLLGEQVRLELAERDAKRKLARAAAAQIAPEVIEPTSSPVVEVVPEPEKKPEMLIEESTDLAPAIEESTEVAVQEVRSDVGELLEESEDVPEPQAYVFQGLQNEESLGEGLESRVTRGVDVFTEKKVLKFEAKPGMGDYLLNHASHLQKLSYKSGFLKLIHVSSEGETPFMICEDPGTIPVEEVLPKLNLTQRIDLVKQLADRLKTLHVDLGVLHRDLRPDQVYVCQKEDGSFELYLSDFGVAAKMGEENELECSLEDPTHARAVSHFKAVFASADVAEGLPFDVQAEIEVFSKVGAYLLTRLVPSRGVEVGLRKIKPDAKDAAEVEKVKHCLSTAAAEREDRYQNMSEFCYDLNARSPMTPDQLKALHGIYAAFKNDLEMVVQQVRVLEEGEIQLAAEPLKTLRLLLPGFATDMSAEAKQDQAPLLEKLDAALAKAIATLEKNEAGIIQELEKIGKERDREFREEESVTAGDEIILAFLDHPSDRVRVAAVLASSLHHQNLELIPCNDRVVRKAREVLLGSSTTEYPKEWETLWSWYSERTERASALIIEHKTAVKDLFIRMVGEKVDNLNGVFRILERLVFEFSKDDIVKISSVAVTKLKSLQKASEEGKKLYDREMAKDHNWSFGLYRVLFSKVEQSCDLSSFTPEHKEEIIQTQKGIVDFLLQYSLSQSPSPFPEETTPFFFEGHSGSENKMTKEWDPTQISRLMNGIVEAPENSVFSCTPWVVTNMLRHGYITTAVAIKVLRRLVKDGQRLTNFDCRVLESSYLSGTGDAACVAEFLLENMTDTEVNSALESPRLASLVKRKVADLRVKLVELTREKPDAKHEINEILSEISACLKYNQSSRDQTGKITVDEYMKAGQISAAVDLAVDVLDFDGKFLTQLMSDVFEAAKKDKEIQNKYKLFPFKNRGRKYAIEGTHYNKILEKIFESLDKNLLKPLNEGGRLEHAQFYPVYLNELSLTLKNILNQLLNPDQSAFFRDHNSTIWRM